jgi:hypothetical protein
MKKLVYYVPLFDIEVLGILRKRGQQALNENVRTTHDRILCGESM